MPTLITFCVRITSPTTWTTTNWPMGCCFTKCTLATRAVHNARIKALVFYAGSVIWTVNIMMTFTSLNYKENYLVFTVYYLLIYDWLFLLGTHRLYGSPVSPGGHLQLALWLSTVHSALIPQGLSTLQGLTQALFLQAWLDAHSLSLEQPTSIGATKNKINHK